MRIKSLQDLDKLGHNAKQQIEAVLQQSGGFRGNNKAPGVSNAATSKPGNPSAIKPTNLPSASKKKTKPARVMRTADNLTYCPWPSTDPFVAVHQRLESKFGLYREGGRLITEMIIDGNETDWRFDFVIVAELCRVEITDQNQSVKQSWMGPVMLAIESDGYGPHKSKEAFKKDRTKQTHALKQGFLVQRITNDDARNRLDDIINDIDLILTQQRLYPSQYEVLPKGKTQSLFRWLPSNGPC